MTVGDLLGHESVRTTNRYTRANLTAKRQALEAFWGTVDLSEGQGAPWAPKAELLEILASLWSQTICTRPVNPSSAVDPVR
jgi:hypothetical protein